MREEFEPRPIEVIAGSPRGDRPASRSGIRVAGLLIPALWTAAAVSGMWALASYKVTPGEVGQTPAVVPETTELEADFASGRPWHLLMFVHPHCPCSRAGVSQLAEIVARHRDVLTARVIFVTPQSAGADWQQTSLRAAAAAIPGVRVSLDEGGALAHRFGAQTSGHVVLYGADGGLRFSGGITRSRGHEGDSTGSRTVSDLLSGPELSNGNAAENARTPVFGCPLFAPQDQCARDGVSPQK